MKFGVGQPVRRFEDQTLHYRHGPLYRRHQARQRRRRPMCCARRIAHANIRKIDTAAARSMPGVLLVLTGDDVKADGLGDVPCLAPLQQPRRHAALPTPPRPMLAHGQRAPCRPAGRAGGRRDARAGAGRRRADRDRLRAAARRHRRDAPRSSPARRSCSTASRAISCFDWDNDTRTSRRPTPPSPRPRMSSRSRWSTIAWW